MRKTLLITALTLLTLNSCATLAPSPTATSAPTLTPLPTETPSPTLTPSPSPTATATALPTPDGAQIFDEERGLWTKTEGGPTLYFVSTPDGQGVWAETATPNPIYTLDKMLFPEEVAKTLPDGFRSMPITVYYLPGSERGLGNRVIQTPSYVEFWQLPDNEKFKRATTSTGWTRFLYARLYGKTDTFDHAYADTIDKLSPLLDDLNNKVVTLPLDIPMIAHDNSNVTTKYWRVSDGIQVIVVPFSSTDGDESYFGGWSPKFRWKLDVIGGADEQLPGQLVYYMASRGGFSSHVDFYKTQVLTLGWRYAMLSQKLPTFDTFSVDISDGNTNLVPVLTASGKSTFEIVRADNLIMGVAFAFNPAGYDGGNAPPFFSYP